jgi:hypothetical protein
VGRGSYKEMPVRQEIKTFKAENAKKSVRTALATAL